MIVFQFSAIVEKNPARFRLNSSEVTQRRCFVQATREEVKNIKSKVQVMRGQDFDHSSRKVKAILILLLWYTGTIINWCSY